MIAHARTATHGGQSPAGPRIPRSKVPDARRRDPLAASACFRVRRTRGEVLFNGKAQCAGCHPAPSYTDNSMHNLQAERFYKQELVDGMMMAHDGPIKTFPLRGIKDSPPYLHDGRCLTLEDAAEHFNLIQHLHLTGQEKTDLVAFLRAL
jgi:cytochrome c peroxidase